MDSINKKSFTLVNRISKSFSLFVDNFQKNVTFIFRIRPRIILTFVASVFGALHSTIVVKPVMLVVSKTKLIIGQVQTLNIKSPILTLRMRLLEKWSVAMTSYVPITFYPMKLTGKIYSAIRNYVPITFTPILAQFGTLGQYDDLTLEVMDLELLGDLDYTVI